MNICIYTVYFYVIKGIVHPKMMLSPFTAVSIRDLIHVAVLEFNGQYEFNLMEN